MRTISVDEFQAELKAQGVPVEHQDEVKRSLARQPRQAGLGLDGSSLSPALRAYVEGRRA